MLPQVLHVLDLVEQTLEWCLQAARSWPSLSTARLSYRASHAQAGPPCTQVEELMERKRELNEVKDKLDEKDIK